MTCEVETVVNSENMVICIVFVYSTGLLVWARPLWGANLNGRYDDDGRSESGGGIGNWEEGCYICARGGVGEEVTTSAMWDSRPDEELFSEGNSPIK